MPGKKRPTLKPAAYLVDVAPTAGPLWIDLESPPRRIEGFPLVDGVAKPQWVDLPRRQVLSGAQTFALPDGARKLKLYDPTDAPVFKTIRLGLNVRKRFLFVSEGFGGDEKQFFAACEGMANKLLKTEPFKTVESSIGIDGLFLPLRGGAVVDIECGRSAVDDAKLQPTLFGTQSCLTNVMKQLWGGDEDRVRALVAKSLKQKSGPLIGEFDFLAILIKSSSYGGAGSSGPADLKPRIAWATTDNASSFYILLHELGHAFELQDEYIDAYEGPKKPWHNISVKPEPKNTPWEKLVTENRDDLTWPKDKTWTGSEKAVGTFQGAGYHPDDRYRPSYDCRMRNIAQPFCPVCTAVILDKLVPAAENRVGEET